MLHLESAVHTLTNQSSQQLCEEKQKQNTTIPILQVGKLKRVKSCPPIKGNGKTPLDFNGSRNSPTLQRLKA